MRRRAYRHDQDRNGNPERRRKEFLAVQDQIRRRKEAFIARLERRIEPRGECRCYKGSLDHKGYARLTLSYKPDPKKPREVVVIGAHRLFLLLSLQRPIREGYEAGHTEKCEHRTCVAHLREEHYSTNAVTNKAQT